MFPLHGSYWLIRPRLSLSLCQLVGAVAAALCVIPVTSRGQIFVANFENNTIGEYNATTGATINSSLVSGLSGPEGIVVSSSVPEPASTTLLLLGMTAIFGVKRLLRKLA